MVRPRLAAAAALLLAGACSMETIDFGGSGHAPAGLSLEVVRVESAARGPQVTLRLRNESREPFYFRGWSAREPVVWYATSLEVGWSHSTWVSCGFGLNEWELKPGQGFEFKTGLPAAQKLPRGRVRVGVFSMERPFGVWSQTIDVPTQRWAAKV